MYIKLYRAISIVQPSKENSWIVGMAFLALSLKIYSFMPNKKIYPQFNVCVMKSTSDSMGILLIQFQVWDLNMFMCCLTEESVFEFC